MVLDRKLLSDSSKEIYGSKIVIGSNGTVIGKEQQR